MNQLTLTDNAIQPMAKMFRSRFDILLEELSTKYPKTFEAIVKEAVAQEAVKKFSLKGLFKSLEKGGLFGRNGVFSFLGKTLFKKTSTDLVAKPPLSKEGDTNIDTSSIVSSSPLQTNTKRDGAPKELDFLPAGDVKPIPIEFAGFTAAGKDQFAEVLPPIFEDILKNVFKSSALTDLFAGLQPEEQKEYGAGLIPGALDFLGDAALAGSLFGGKGRILGKRGILRAPFRRFRAGRIRAQRAAQKAATTLPKPPTAAPAAVKGATKAAGTGAARGLARGASRAVPILGTVLTAGMLASDISTISEQEEKGEISEQEAYKAKGGAFGGAGGALAGAAGGAALGTLIAGPVGTVIGGVAGGILGGMAGEAGGTAIGEAVAPEEEQPMVAPLPTPEIPQLDIPESKDYSETLNDIASNTNTTSNKISRLSDAIFALANTLSKSQTTTTAPTVAVLNNNQEQGPSASQIAASNIDAIRSIRRQFYLS